MENRIIQIAVDNGAVVNGKLISYTKFKKLTVPHKFTNNCYQVYLGRVGNFLKCNPYMLTRSKERANRMFYEALEAVLDGDTDVIDNKEIMVCERVSVTWG